MRVFKENEMIQDKLIQKFGGHINHMSCIYLNDGEHVLRYFLHKHRPIDTAIEIGTYQGVSACIIAEYAKRVYTVDTESKELTEKIIEHLNVKNISINVVDSRPHEIALVKHVFKKNKVDFCFIDGEHYNGELEKDFDMLKECKNILIHDYTPNFPEVYNFCNSLKGYEKDVRGSFVLLTKKDTISFGASTTPKKKTTRKKSVRKPKNNT